MAEITCDEMLELASLGAKVLHPRAVEIARNYGVESIPQNFLVDPNGNIVATNLKGDALVQKLSELLK